MLPILSFAVRNNSKIYFRVVYRHRTYIRTTNISCDLTQWDARNHCVKKSHPHHGTINVQLSVIMQRANKLALNAELNRSQFNPKTFLDSLFEKNTAAVLVDWLEKEIMDRKSLCAANTHKTRMTQLNKLKQFAPTATLTDINAEWIQRYHVWYKGTGCNGTTTSKALVLLRTFMNWALQKEKISENPFKKYTIKGYTADKRVLSMAEIDRLCEVYQSTQLTAPQRDTLRHFLFACFTGLRFSDMQNLKTCNLEGDTLHIVQQKTIEPLRIPIGAQAKQFLPSITGDHLFQISSNQKTNKVLHRISQKVQIRPFTYHSARHTFITMLIELNVALPIIQKLVGHADIKTTIQYSYIANRVKKEAMNVLDRHFTARSLQ